MKSLFMRLKKRKGFTLVECIIAMAVFAAFCLMVLMIASGAQKETKLANDIETEVNVLLENVTADDIERSYLESRSDKSLNMKFSIDGSSSSQDFSVSYDVIEGHKNYVYCETCKYFGPNTEFMDGTTPLNFKPWDDPALTGDNMNYKCPQCETEIKGSSDFLVCQDCGLSGDYKSSNDKFDKTKIWTYQPGSGAFICNACGGGNVVHKFYDLGYVENANVSVSGMVANAIRYGKVKPPSQETVIEVKDDVSGPNPDSKAYVHVKYSVGGVTPTGNTNVFNPNNIGTYTITISGVTKVDDDDAHKTSVTIRLPEGYIVSDFKSSSGKSSYTVAADGKVQISYLSSDADGTVGESDTITFSLRNEKTGFSFDYDYQNVKRESDSKVVTGLAAYWFGLSGNNSGTTWPIPTTP